MYEFNKIILFSCFLLLATINTNANEMELGVKLKKVGEKKNLYTYKLPSGNGRIEWDNYRAVFYSAKGEKPFIIYEGKNEGPTEEDSSYGTFSGKIISVIGDYIGYHTSSSMYEEGSRGSYSLSDDWFVNVKNKKKILLQDIIPLENFLPLFLSMNDIKFEEDNLVSQMKKLESYMSWDSSLFGSFTFDDVVGNKVLTNINASASYGRQGAYLETYLLIPKHLRTMFKKAHKNGTLYNDLSQLKYPPRKCEALVMNELRNDYYHSLNLFKNKKYGLAVKNLETFFKKNNLFQFDKLNKLKSYNQFINDYAYFMHEHLKSQIDEKLFCHSSGQNTEIKKLSLKKDLEKIEKILFYITSRDENRIVTYLNLADVKSDLGKAKEASEYYQKYIAKMKEEKKEKYIPKRIYEYLKKPKIQNGFICN